MEWEERWWEASDWAGMREMGAEKSGCAADGSAWRETWREAIAFDTASGEPIVERSAHKWAQDAKVLPPPSHLARPHAHMHVCACTQRSNMTSSCLLRQGKSYCYRVFKIIAE